jgi:hypothetical protein
MPLVTDIETLWKDYHGKLHRFIAGRVRDLLQEVFVKIHQSQPSIQDGTPGTKIEDSVALATLEATKALPKRRVILLLLSTQGSFQTA